MKINLIRKLNSHQWCTLVRGIPLAYIYIWYKFIKISKDLHLFYRCILITILPFPDPDFVNGWKDYL